MQHAGRRVGLLHPVTTVGMVFVRHGQQSDQKGARLLSDIIRPHNRMTSLGMPVSRKVA
jgi:hypothetical protein